MTKDSKVWIISDGRGLTGNVNGCLGVAEKISNDITIIDLKGDIEKAGGIASYLKTLGLGRITNEDQWPDYIITFYKNTANVSADIKQLAVSKGIKKPITNVQIRTPGSRISEFDLIANPASEAPLAGRNVMPILGVPHRVSSTALEKGREEWKDVLDAYIEAYKDRKKLFVVLGGDVPNSLTAPGEGGAYSKESAQKLGQEINAIAVRENACVFVTNSHRTSQDAVKAFMCEIQVPSFFHDVRWNDRKNPYFGLMAESDAIIASADSVSICCEAASANKPFFIYNANADYLRHTHKAFAKAMIEGGYAKLYDPDAIRFDGSMHAGKQHTDTLAIAEMAITIHNAKSIKEKMSRH